MMYHVRCCSASESVLEETCYHHVSIMMILTYYYQKTLKYYLESFKLLAVSLSIIVCHDRMIPWFVHCQLSHNLVH